MIEILIHKLRCAYTGLPYTPSRVGAACSGDMLLMAEQTEALGPGSPIIPTKICEMCGGSGRVFTG